MSGPRPIGISRRALLKDAACGFGYLAFAGLASQAAASERNPLAGQAAAFRPAAKRVIFMFMHGGPSQVDTFDYKPALLKYSGKPAPFAKPSDSDEPRKKKIPLLRETPWKFAQHGECGRWVSELFPHVATHVDDLCVINSMHTEGRAHGEATLRLHTGTASFVRPSLGSWVTYGLGTENSNLPGFVTIAPPRAHGGVQNYSSAFLPAIYQGTAIGTADVPVKDASIPYLANETLSPAMQRRQLDLIQQLNHAHLRTFRGRRAGRGHGAVVRAGLPHAVGRAFGARARRRVGGDAQAVRHRHPGDRRLRPAVPAGPPVRRVRRALHPDLHRVPVGPAREARERAREDRPGRRPADRRAADRPQGPRAARRHAGLLGRRVRPHAVHRGGRRPRPQPRGVFASGWPAAA